MKQLVLIAHNLRSAHNVGSLIRTCEGLGLEAVYLTGYTPYPVSENDERLPYLSTKIDKQIKKTSLGAEATIKVNHFEQIGPLLDQLRQDGFTIAALEQDDKAIAINEFPVPDRLALIVGREVEGIEPDILELCDSILEIPMFGKKESFNVVQAAAMAAYHFRFLDSQQS